ncbi:MAG: histidinol-phosphate transaminase [bacterium]
MSRFWSPIVHELDPYVPGEQPKMERLIKLNTNENPYGPSPKALAAMRDCVDERLRLYPDPSGEALKQAIADYYQVPVPQVFVGNGSDEVLAHTFQGLLQHDLPLLFPDITYSFYPVYCGLFEVEHELIPLTEQFEIDPQDYARPNGGIIFANPNAPTGRGLMLESIETIVQANPDSVVVVDEAYIDFGGQSAVSLVSKYPNVLVIQTLSKSRSLAGARVGFAIGHEDLIDGLERVKNSFNSYPLDRVALAGGVAAMQDVDYFEETRQKVMQEREVLTGSLGALGFEVLPSQTNFLFARHPEREADVLASTLRADGIIVRHFNTPRIDQFLRITIGTAQECAALVASLEQILKA